MPDTAKTKKLLEEALRNLPQANAFSSTRIHIKRALSEMYHVEQRKLKKPAASWPNWQLMPETGETLPPAEVERRRKNVLSLLDEMYAKEQEKLDQMDKQTRHEENDDNDVGPILG